MGSVQSRHRLLPVPEGLHRRWTPETSATPRTFAIVGVALEIGIAPTTWHAVDLGLIPGGRDRRGKGQTLK